MLELKTFGNFSVTYKDIRLYADDINSLMVQKLLVYLICHRKDPIDFDKLASDLWAENDIEKPAGALKNLVYRLRTILKKNYGNDDYIILKNGTYFWNCDIECQLDCEAFEELVEASKQEEESEQRINYLKQAIDLYEGDFLSSFISEEWIFQIRVYYHMIFIDAVRALCELYILEKKYSEIISVCTKVLKIERSDEWIYYYLILSHAKMNNIKMATEIYENAIKHFEKEFGSSSECNILKGVYTEILNQHQGALVCSLDSVKKDLLTVETEKVFFCGLGVFREICQLELRKSKRKRSRNSLVLLTVKTPYVFENAKIRSFVIKKIMVAIHNALEASLRQDDVVAKYSDCQYVIFEANCSAKEVELINKRILEYFNSHFLQYKDCELFFDRIEMDE